MGSDRGRRTRRELLGAGGAALAAGLGGCIGGRGASGGGTDRSGGAGEGSPGGDAAWRSRELTDVRTGETFTVDQFAGRPVLLEFFAVWCPVCTRQQEQLGALAAGREDVVPVSLNTDPNEDAATVRSHAAEHGFDWRYAVLPSAVTRALVDRFGPTVTNPPSAPVVKVCPDGTAATVGGSGVKTASDLAAALDDC